MTARTRPGRNRRAADETVVIFWRDIPAQVTVRYRGKTAALELPARFRTAIDRAAMNANKKTYDEYIGEWRREASPIQASDAPVAEGAEGEDAAETARALAGTTAERLQAAYPGPRVVRLVRNGGFEPDGNAGEDEKARGTDL